VAVAVIVTWIAAQQPEPVAYGTIPTHPVAVAAMQPRVFAAYITMDETIEPPALELLPQPVVLPVLQPEPDAPDLPNAPDELPAPTPIVVPGPADPAPRSLIARTETSAEALIAQMARWWEERQPAARPTRRRGMHAIYRFSDRGGSSR
jgi:hypothetical protein